MAEQSIDNLGLKNKQGTYDNFARGDVVRIGKDPRVWAIEKINYLGVNIDFTQNEGSVRFRRKSIEEERNRGEGLFVYLELSFAHLFKYGMKHHKSGGLPDDNPNIAFIRCRGKI